MRFLVETDHKLATNPVAKALARQNLSKAMTLMALRIYSLGHRDECAALLVDIGWVLTLIGMAAKREPAVGPDHPGVSVIRGALSAVNGMTADGKWDTAQARAIEHGINTAIGLNKFIKHQHIMSALDDIKRAA